MEIKDRCELFTIFLRGSNTVQASSCDVALPNNMEYDYPPTQRHRDPHFGKIWIWIWVLAKFLCDRVYFWGILYATGYRMWRDFSHSPVTSLVKYPPWANNSRLSFIPLSFVYQFWCRNFMYHCFNQPT